MIKLYKDIHGEALQYFGVSTPTALIIKCNDVVVGMIDYEIYKDSIKIFYITIEDEYRRQGIAKDLYRELKESWLLYTEELSYIGYVLRFISTSEYHIIKEFFKKRSYSMFVYKDIPLNPDKFYGGYVPIEAFLDYAIMIINVYRKK